MREIMEIQQSGARTPENTTTDTPIKLFVRRRCRELGITLQEVVERADLSRSHLYKLFDGSISDPSVRTLNRLAYALEVPAIVVFRYYMEPSHQIASAALKTSQVQSVTDKRDVVAFSADVTVPDHSLVFPGDRFTKTWAIQNLGDTVWKGRAFVRADDELVIARRVNGALVPILDSHLSSLGNAIPVPETHPGMPCEVSMEFRAPAENCSVASIWRMVDADGAFSFPPEFFVQVIVTVVGY